MVDLYCVGANPDAAPVTLDTVVDKDASAQTPRSSAPHDTLPGATSKDLHGGIGVPASGMTSSEMHHNGQGGRKREGFGVEARHGTHQVAGDAPDS